MRSNDNKYDDGTIVQIIPAPSGHRMAFFETDDSGELIIRYQECHLLALVEHTVSTGGKYRDVEPLQYCLDGMGYDQPIGYCNYVDLIPPGVSPAELAKWESETLMELKATQKKG